jgi:hypothetical protein
MAAPMQPATWAAMQETMDDPDVQSELQRLLHRYRRTRDTTAALTTFVREAIREKHLAMGDATWTLMKTHQLCVLQGQRRSSYEGQKKVAATLYERSWVAVKRQVMVAFEMARRRTSKVVALGERALHEMHALYVTEAATCIIQYHAELEARHSVAVWTEFDTDLQLLRDTRPIPVVGSQDPPTSAIAAWRRRTEGEGQQP